MNSVQLFADAFYIEIYLCIEERLMSIHFTHLVIFDWLHYRFCVIPNESLAPSYQTKGHCYNNWTYHFKLLFHCCWRWQKRQSPAIGCSYWPSECFAMVYTVQAGLECQVSQSVIIVYSFNWMSVHRLVAYFKLSLKWKFRAIKWWIQLAVQSSMHIHLYATSNSPSRG